MNNFRGFRLLPLGVFMLSTSLLLPAALINHSDAAEASIVLGYQGPLTGPEAQIGIDQLNGVQYAVDVFNKKFEGKIKVTLKTIDDQGDPTVAGPVAQATARDSNLLGIVGPAYSGATIASLPFYKPAGIPLIQILLKQVRGFQFFIDWLLLIKPKALLSTKLQLPVSQTLRPLSSMMEILTQYHSYNI
jgi:hypothetical protein